MELETTTSWRSGSGQTVCRCCLAEGCYKDISTEYFWMGKREVYSEMLLETFDLNIAFSANGVPNSNSRLICEPCIGRLRDATEFKRQVHDCEKVFMQHLEPGPSAVSEIEVASEPEKPVKMETVKLEKVDSDDDEVYVPEADPDDDDESDLDDEPLTKFATKVPKKEADELMDLLDQPKPAPKRKISVKPKATLTKKVKVPTSKEPKPSSSKAATTKAAQILTKTEKKKKDKRRRLYKGYDASTKNAILILRYSTASPFKTNVKNEVRCCFCQEAFKIPEDFHQHMIEKHENVAKSIVAESTYTYNGLPRVDVTDLRCRTCPKLFSSLETLASHLADEHSLEIDFSRNLGLVPICLKTPYFCLVCNSKFNSLYSLWRHGGSHFAKNVCELCGCGFETYAGLSAHISSVHDVVQKCRLCKSKFQTKDEFLNHQRTTAACRPYGCSVVGCAVRFSSWEVRQKHLISEHGVKPKTFPCSECDEVLATQKSYYRHFKSSHTNDYKCQYCGRGFSCLRDLEEHLPRHTGFKPHQCTICGKMFTTRKGVRDHTNMHATDEPGRVRFSCPVCERVFIFRKKLLTHIRKTHFEMYQQIATEKGETENNQVNAV